MSIKTGGWYWQACWHTRADSRLAPSQWETPLLSNVVSHWLGANLDNAQSPSGCPCQCSVSICLSTHQCPVSIWATPICQMHSDMTVGISTEASCHFFFQTHLGNWQKSYHLTYQQYVSLPPSNHYFTSSEVHTTLPQSVPWTVRVYWNPLSGYLSLIPWWL